MHWEDEGYSRTDKDGNPISFVCCCTQLYNGYYTNMAKVEYEKQAVTQKLGTFMTGGDLMLYSITG
jgi:hypothetical protein